jgi:creatinine amidohydrolase/Fe(II)-dependent formamide hydrolase-like protein
MMPRGGARAVDPVELSLSWNLDLRRRPARRVDLRFGVAIDPVMASVEKGRRAFERLYDEWRLT